MSEKPKKVGLAEVTWPFVVLAVCLDALFVAAYILTGMTEQMFYQLESLKLAFLAGIIGGAVAGARAGGGDG
jgi:hypothetical protein